MHYLIKAIALLTDKYYTPPDVVAYMESEEDPTFDVVISDE
jgi:hypothetical protein